MNPATNMKQARVCIHVSMGDRGQQRRPVLLNYRLAEPLKGYLYRIIACKDVHKPDHYEVDGPSGIIALNGQDMLDEMIAAANPEMMEERKKRESDSATYKNIDPKHAVRAASKPKPRHESEGEQLPFA